MVGLLIGERMVMAVETNPLNSATLAREATHRIGENILATWAC